MAVLLALYPALKSQAGPPFLTDDPEPVELNHWEVYLFGQGDVKFTENLNLLFSAGRSVSGDRHTVWYLGLYSTGGPDKTLDQPKNLQP